jgi:hypothetical protein
VEDETETTLSLQETSYHYVIVNSSLGQTDCQIFAHKKFETIPWRTGVYKEG